MKKLIFAVTLPAFIATGTLAGTGTNAPAATLAKIGAAAANEHYNQSLVVTGLVAQVSVRPGIVFINLDQPYPDSPFVAVILGDSTNQFPHVKSLKGAQVEISGQVVNYKDRPEIVLTNAAQVKVTMPPAAPAVAHTGTNGPAK